MDVYLAVILDAFSPRVMLQCINSIGGLDGFDVVIVDDGMTMEISLTTNEFSGDLIRKREVSGLNLIEGTYSPKTKIASHSHDQALFCIALEGTCEEIYASKTRNYEVFALEFLPANHNHSLSFTREGTRVFSVNVPPRWLEHARDYSLKLDESVFGRGWASLLFLKVYREFLISDSASSLAIEGLTLEMLAEVSRHNRPNASRTAPKWLSQVIDLLHARFHERLSLAKAAAEVNVHPVHLAREFRRFKKCTIGEYIRRLRIEQACYELSSSTKPIAAIAAGAGFADQSHFSRTFKRFVGMKPVEYRTTLGAR